MHDQIPRCEVIEESIDVPCTGAWLTTGRAATGEVGLTPHNRVGGGETSGQWSVHHRQVKVPRVLKRAGRGQSHVFEEAEEALLRGITVDNHDGPLRLARREVRGEALRISLTDGRVGRDPRIRRRCVRTHSHRHITGREHVIECAV